MPFLSALVHDLRSALRRLRRQPVFASAVGLTVALAIGANTAIFTVVHAVVLRQLPFAEADRLVVVHAREAGGESQPFSIADFLDLRAESKSLERLAAFGSWSANLTGVDQPVRLPAQWVTEGLLDMLGARAAIGRTPHPEEERPGGGRVVLLSHGLWRTQFGGDPAILGRALTLNGEPYTVIGVLPADFVYLTPGAQLVTPLVVETDARRAKRGAGFLRVIARLRGGAAGGAPPPAAAASGIAAAKRAAAATTAAAATAELDAIVARLRAAHPGTNAGKLGVRLEPLAERIVGAYRRSLLVLWGAVVLVLVIACTNLASLFLARLVSRRPELALRAALGAGRRDILRQLLAEAAVITLVGGALGVLLAWLGVRALPALAPAQLPRLAEVRISGTVLVFSLGLSLAAGLLFGLLPALQGSRPDLTDGLKSGGRGGRRPGRARSALVALEVGLAVVLLVCGGLMLRSLRRLQETDPGFRPERLISVQLSLPKKRYASPEAIDRYREAVTSRLSTLPGVESAAAASVNPLTAWRASVSYTVEGRAEPTRERPSSANYRAVSPGYFATLGMPLLEGRDLSESDRRETAPVAVVSASFARRHFARGGAAAVPRAPGEAIAGAEGASALGSRIVIDDTESWRAVTIVGVVGDVKHTGLDADGTADVYVPYAQAPQDVAVWLANILCVAVRTKGDPRLSLDAVRREIVAVDPDVAASAVRTMDQALATSLADRRFSTTLLDLFGVVALALALAGVYAMTSIGVAERRREIGVRLSVGASPADVLALIVRRSLAPVGAGVVAGACAALAAARLVSGLLFGVSSRDTLTFTTVAAALLVTALLASLVPALRATRIDPVSVLRSE